MPGFAPGVKGGAVAMTRGVPVSPGVVTRLRAGSNGATEAAGGPPALPCVMVELSKDGLVADGNIETTGASALSRRDGDVRALWAAEEGNERAGVRGRVAAGGEGVAPKIADEADGVQGWWWS